MARPVTKPGRYGTLYLYEIVYTDEDPGFGRKTWRTWAYNLEHAEDKFYESGDDGFVILELFRVQEGLSQHRAVRHAPRG